ncbi:hypothetical protein, partial [Bradyrhizobium sp. Mp27]|uniref:hypothetical protein n=1 Tax=Bradyrhizobium sp. Mp27 TaxID=3042157 RepID=UPI00248B43D9
AHQGGPAERKAMIDRDHDLSIVRQAKVLKLARSTVYYPRGSLQIPPGVVSQIPPPARQDKGLLV